MRKQYQILLIIIKNDVASGRILSKHRNYAIDWL